MIDYQYMRQGETGREIKLAKIEKKVAVQGILSKVNPLKNPSSPWCHSSLPSWRPSSPISFLPSTLPASFPLRRQRWGGRREEIGSFENPIKRNPRTPNTGRNFLSVCVVFLEKQQQGGIQEILAGVFVARRAKQSVNGRGFGFLRIVCRAPGRDGKKVQRNVF